MFGQAKTQFELDGTRLQESEAYGVGGLVVLNQSDLLVVVWDGERQGKRGGTEDTLNEARKRGVTVAWIDAKHPENWLLLDAATPFPTVNGGQGVVPNRSGTPAAIRSLVRQVLESPKPPQAATLKSDDERIDPESALKTFSQRKTPAVQPGRLLAASS